MKSINDKCQCEEMRKRREKRENGDEAAARWRTAPRISKNISENNISKRRNVGNIGIVAASAINGGSGEMAKA
jgi:hypothetical protein